MAQSFDAYAVSSAALWDQALKAQFAPIVMANVKTKSPEDQDQAISHRRSIADITYLSVDVI